MNPAIETALAAILSADFRRAVFSGVPRVKGCPWRGVTVKPVELRGERHWQFEYTDGQKQITQNFTAPTKALEELFGWQFSGVHITTTEVELNLHTTKKGVMTLGRSQAKTKPDAPTPHNRIKNVPLPEGTADPLLETLGIMTATGQVKPTMRDKFKQINEFLKHLSHTLSPAGIVAGAEPLVVLDCGCGASYLTFAAHHYLNTILGIPAIIHGVDIKSDIIQKSIQRAEKLGAKNLNFACEKIGQADIRADIVLALHACDTATDDALAQAVKSKAKLILSVPCCHQTLNSDFAKHEAPAAWGSVLRHGILRERTADIVTDALRASALRVLGYRTEVVEFVSLEHTARNLMIRAIRSKSPAPQAAQEYLALRDFWGVTPPLEARLGESFQRLLG
ncbi:MAG: class I SAM-dependent methyltransferase [Fimbriiglobus sp.]